MWPCFQGEALGWFDHFSDNHWNTHKCTAHLNQVCTYMYIPYKYGRVGDKWRTWQFIPTRISLPAVCIDPGRLRPHFSEWDIPSYCILWNPYFKTTLKIRAPQCYHWLKPVPLIAVTDWRQCPSVSLIEASGHQHHHQLKPVPLIAVTDWSQWPSKSLTETSVLSC